MKADCLNPWYNLLNLKLNLFEVDKKDATISFIVFRDFSMFYQIFLLPKVKGCAIITCKHGIYELPHKLANNLRLRKLGNIRNVSKLHRMID